MALAGEEYSCSLSLELQKKALDELNEKAEWRPRDIQALREMILSNRALTCPTTDHYLLRFLRAKKFDYDRAYQQIVNYYEIRAKNSEYLEELQPSSILPCLEAGVTCLLPHKDKHGRRILYFRPGKWDPSMFSVYQILKANLMNLELAIQDEEVQVNGVVLLNNMKGVGWKQAKALERKYFKLTTSLLQEAFPLRFKGMNVVHEPSVFQHIFALMKPFLKEKSKSRLRFYGSDVETLQEDFGLDVLPEELGGRLGPGDVLAQEWKQTLLSKEEYFAGLRAYRMEMNHHISASKSSDNAECLVGTYRKLNVD